MVTYQQLELSNMQRENMRREERKEQMTRILRQQGRGGITLRQLCRLAGVTKSPYTQNLMADICHEGHACWDWALHANGRQVRVFFPKGE